MQDGSNSPEGVDAALCGDTDDRSRCGAEVSAPFRSKVAGDLASGSRGAEFAFAAAVEHLIVLENPIPGVLAVDVHKQASQ